MARQLGFERQRRAVGEDGQLLRVVNLAKRLKLCRIVVMIQPFSRQGPPDRLKGGGCVGLFAVDGRRAVVPRELYVRSVINGSHSER